jgi:hypothetical protein
MFGGYTLAWTRWERTEDGWDMDARPVPGAGVYVSAELAAQAAERIPGAGRPQ